MSLLLDFDSADDYLRCYVAVGNFDGVHRGHQKIVAKLVERAKSAGTKSIVLTFDPHPIRLLRPEQAPPSLTTLSQKGAILETLGVDFVIGFPTTRKFLSLTPDEFFEQIIVQRLQARGLVEGANFQFGKGRAGNMERLGELCRRDGLMLDVVGPVEQEGEPISSSRIRIEIAAGRIHEAVALLGHPYGIQGTVVKGAGRGASLGFPTANLDGVETLLPADGVYAAFVCLDDTDFPAAVHVGPNPTFADGQRKLEVHIVGHTGDLYGRQLTAHLLTRIRDVTRFENAEQLRTQLESDIATTIRIADT